MEETVTSSAMPGRANGGREAVTNTAAIFFTMTATGRNLHPHALHDVGQGLGGEQGLLPVSRAVQSDHQAVAHQRIVTHAGDGGDVAHQHGLRPGHGTRNAAP